MIDIGEFTIGLIMIPHDQQFLKQDVLPLKSEIMRNMIFDIVRMKKGLIIRIKREEDIILEELQKKMEDILSMI